ncbi:MAG: hypothetical protein AAGD25_06815 [Cyanobacteria bacterium P01_F01_bin.150]
MNYIVARLINIWAKVHIINGWTYPQQIPHLCNFLTDSTVRLACLRVDRLTAPLIRYGANSAATVFVFRQPLKSTINKALVLGRIGAWSFLEVG